MPQGCEAHIVADVAQSAPVDQGIDDEQQKEPAAHAWLPHLDVAGQCIPRATQDGPPFVPPLPQHVVPKGQLAPSPHSGPGGMHSADTSDVSAATHASVLLSAHAVQYDGALLLPVTAHDARTNALQVSRPSVFCTMSSFAEIMHAGHIMFGVCETTGHTAAAVAPVESTVLSTQE